MDELLSAFDPLHSGSNGRKSPNDGRTPLFPSVPATSTSVSTTSSAAPSTSTSVAHPPAVPVSLKHAPLDLLSFDDDNNEERNDTFQLGPTTTGTLANNTRAEQRQKDVLAELEGAELQVDWMGASTSVGGVSNSNTLPQARSVPLRNNSNITGLALQSSSSNNHPPRPPRRLSRSGLMHDTPSSSSSSFPHHQLQNTHDPPLITHALASPTSLTSNPSDLFHPSSPPAGSSLDDLRHKSGYFSNLGGLGRSIGPSSSSTSRGAGQRGVASSISPPPQPHPSSSSAHTFQNIDNSDLFASTSSSSYSNRQQPRPSQQVPPQPTSSSSPSSSYSPQKPPKRSHTFDFPTTSNLSSSTTLPPPQNSARLPNPRTTTLQNSHRTSSSTATSKSNSNGLARAASPASTSLTIDSEPLPGLVLKVPLAAQGGNRVLTEDIAEGIRPSLSSRLKLQKTWSLLYSLDAHGTSLHTLYSRVQSGLAKSAGGCVLAVRDMEGAVFGAYVNEAFVKREGYYGNGECFLWKVDSFPSSDDFRVGPLVRPYRWTGSNDYLILSDSSFLSIGGGNGKFGLWLDSEFDKGFSTPCPAFRNEVLCSERYVKRIGKEGEKEARFEIQAVECWAVG